MKWRVIKRVYSDGTEWFYLQHRGWFGIWKDLEPNMNSITVDHLWLGFSSIDLAIAECDRRNNIITLKSKIPVYP